MKRKATLLIFADDDFPGWFNWNLQIKGTRRSPRYEYIASYLDHKNVDAAVAEARLTARRWGIRITATEGLD